MQAVLKLLRKALQSSFTFKWNLLNNCLSGKLKYNSLKLNFSLTAASCSADPHTDIVLLRLTQFLD